MSETMQRSISVCSGIDLSTIEHAWMSTSLKMAVSTNHDDDYWDNFYKLLGEKLGIKIPTPFNDDVDLDTSYQCIWGDN